MYFKDSDEEQSRIFLMHVPGAAGCRIGHSFLDAFRLASATRPCRLGYRRALIPFRSCPPWAHPGSQGSQTPLAAWQWTRHGSELFSKIEMGCFYAEVCFQNYLETNTHEYDFPGGFTLVGIAAVSIDALKLDTITILGDHLGCCHKILRERPPKTRTLIAAVNFHKCGPERTKSWYYGI